MSDQLEPPQQPFQGQPVYYRPPISNQQQPHTGYPQQSGTNSGYPPQPYPQQPQWGQPPTPGQPQWRQLPISPQYGYPQQTQYTGQFAQNNVYTPPPSPQFQQNAPKLSVKDFFKKRVSIPVWAISLVIILLISVFATSVYAIGSKSNTPSTSASTSSSNTVGQTSSIPTSVPTSAPIPTDIPTSAPTSVPTSVGPSKIGGTITTVDGLVCTLVSVQPIQGDDITYPKPGDMFIVVHIKMTNNSSSDYNYFSYNFQVISGSGNGTGSIDNPPITYTANNLIFIGTLIPGGTVQGDLIFEVSIGDHKAELSWQPDPTGNVTDNVWNLGL